MGINLADAGHATLQGGVTWREVIDLSATITL